MEFPDCWLFFALICLNINTLYSLDCYSCQNIDDPHTCNSTISCQTSQVCYLGVKGGIYTMGCADNQHCGGTAAVGIVGRDVVQRQTSNCLECCSTDGCNSDMCKHPKPTVCIDDETVDCARMNTIFHVCQDIQQAKLVCPKFCDLCTLVDGQWSQWSTWSNCDVTCNKGIQTRTRTCTNPAPANGGLDCVGNGSETKHCTQNPCPVHGGWSNWSTWGTCSVSCDIGMQRRDRACSNPYPSLNGDHCFGESRDDRICMPGACADGGWSNWGSWGTCSDSCGGGVQSRLRTCSNPKPSLLGRYCNGSPEQIMPCNKHSCPENNVAFTAYNLNTSSSSNAVLQFTTTVLNNGNAYSTTTGKFTCQIPGVYHFSVTLTKSYTNIYTMLLIYLYAYLRINGSNKLYLHWDPNADGWDEYAVTPLTMSGTYHLNKNDVVYVYGVPNNFHDSFYSQFTGYLITPDQ